MGNQFDTKTGHIRTSKGQATDERCHLVHPKLFRVSPGVRTSSTARCKSRICSLSHCPDFCQVWPVVSLHSRNITHVPCMVTPLISSLTITCAYVTRLGVKLSAHISGKMACFELPHLR